MRLAEIVEREYGWMLAQSLRLCHNRMDAEDLAGDAVLKILASPKNYDDSRPFRPWCSVIILNTYITRYHREGLVTFTDICDMTCISSCDTSSHVQVSDMLGALRRCRKRSSTIDCVLMFASGFSYEEISAYYGIPSGTVRSRISSARRMIREELGNQYVK